MKKCLYTILFVWIFTGCIAQQKLPRGTFKVNSEQFNIYYFNEHENHVLIANTKNKYAEGVPFSTNPYAFPMSQEDIHFNKEKVKQIVFNILKKKLTKLHNNKEELSVSLVIETINGKITDIRFGINKNTFITLENIAEMDKQIRNSITATFTGRAYKDYVATVYRIPLIIF